MLSGIGPANHLKKHGIPVVKDHPEVGSNLYDHPNVDFYFKHSQTIKSATFLVPQGFSDSLKLVGALLQYYVLGTGGALSTNVCIQTLPQLDYLYDAVSSTVKLLRSCARTIQHYSLHPNIQRSWLTARHRRTAQIWNCSWLRRATRSVLEQSLNDWSLIWLVAEPWEVVLQRPNALAPCLSPQVGVFRSTFSLWLNLIVRPTSKGTIELKSSNPFDHPKINPK